MAYLLDAAVILLLCMIVLPLFDQITPMQIIDQIQIVHASTDLSVTQQETMTLMRMIEACTIGFAMIGCVYDVVLLSLCHATLGKLLCRLTLVCDEAGKGKELIRIVIRSAVKALMTAFLGSIVLVLSGFSVIASPIQLSIQDRIAHTRITTR